MRAAFFLIAIGIACFLGQVEAQNLERLRKAMIYYDNSGDTNSGELSEPDFEDFINGSFGRNAFSHDEIVAFFKAVANGGKSIFPYNIKEYITKMGSRTRLAEAIMTKFS